MEVRDRVGEVLLPRHAIWDGDYISPVGFVFRVMLQLPYVVPGFPQVFNFCEPRIHAQTSSRKKTSVILESCSINTRLSDKREMGASTARENKRLK